MLVKQVELFLAKYDLLKPKNNILVAFSGGYDSMCLLHIMQNLAQKYDLNITAIHLNHNWRGAESDREEKNCRIFAQNINFYSERLSNDIPHTETCARDARYEFFEKCAKKFNSKVILTAHNANDNAETVFYRIIKGTGITGIEGIQENRGIYFRPLLNIYRKDIENYCKENNLTPNNDSSNSNTNYARNKIRLEILPLLKEISPDIEEKLNSLSNSAKEINKIFLKNIKKLEDYSTEEFCSQDEFIQLSIIHNFLRTNDILDYDKKRIETILEFINKNKDSKSGKTISITTNKLLFVSNKNFELINAENNSQQLFLSVNKEGIYNIGDYRFEINKVETMPEKFPNPEDNFAYVSIENFDLTLRTRCDGDIIQPLGLNGTQKLKKFLNEKKIPKHERDNLVFLCKNNEVLWAPCYGISEKIKVKTKPTHIIKMERNNHEN